jgi:hypothetical protein
MALESKALPDDRSLEGFVGPKGADECFGSAAVSTSGGRSFLRGLLLEAFVEARSRGV